MKKNNEILNKPSHTFCEACKNSDIRILKDNMNIFVDTINRISIFNNIEGKDIFDKCKKLNELADKSRREETKILLGKVKRKKR